MCMGNTPTKTVKFKYPNDLAKLRESVMPKLQELFKVKVSFEGTPVINGTCSFFNDDGSGKVLQTWPEFREYIDYIRPAFYDYVDSLGLNKEEAWLRGMWANNYVTGAYAKKHSHKLDTEVFGILFYLQKPENSGDLYIEIPQNELVEEYKANIEEGDIIIFSSGLVHWTDPNINVKEKIVIGMEITLIPNLPKEQQF